MRMWEHKPAISPEMRRRARSVPNNWLLITDPGYDLVRGIPAEAVIGRFRVDARGRITDDYVPNPRYRPAWSAPRARPRPEPPRPQVTQRLRERARRKPNEWLDVPDPRFADRSKVPSHGIIGRYRIDARGEVTDDYEPNPDYRPQTPQAFPPGAAFAPAASGYPASSVPSTNIPATVAVHANTLTTVNGTSPVPPAQPVVAPAVEAKAAQTKAIETGTDQVGADPVEVPREDAMEERFVGSILGGAVGDALGYGIEFLTIDQIRRLHGDRGLADFNHREGPAEISDDTQMTLFTLEGLIRAHIRRRQRGTGDDIRVIQHAYQRWLHTQGRAWAAAGGSFAEDTDGPDGWLVSHRELFATRAPGNTCISALLAFARSDEPAGITRRINDSKGCGGVMRAAPVALWSEDPAEVFDLGATTGALTHSHPSGYLPAGVLAVIVHQLIRGGSLPAAVDTARSLLARWEGHEESLSALDRAIELTGQGRPTPELIAERLGGGWIGEEALAIGLCAALATDNVAEALVLAVNHNGDSDSTGAICGNIAGARYGLTAIPVPWLENLELRQLIETVARDGLREFGQQPPESDDWYTRYPGW
ncbi:hypothetical protein GCM10012275_25190 [Longimycelium tulufanense]|uniref:ADP-ribosylglycohydrolase n=1 Tax=Longimycelium tulufanense TaxID=907463 RepID=A0A8J3FTY0_9PSEU|nr:ADP-ribosylglycohydrolase family protein [Longimycelium tulufanense]GGM53157.1 hypothetical protein GCM10012275_25190 [Longimycelium tulufanense]